jgi:hypothetical protein
LAVRRAAATAEHAGDAAHQCLLDLLGRDEMDMGVHAAGREQQPLAGDDLRGDAHNHARSHPGHDVGIPGFADSGEEAVFDANVGFVDAGVIHDERIGDDTIQSVLRAHARGLAHAFANDLAAAELALVAVMSVVALDLQPE